MSAKTHKKNTFGIIIAIIIAVIIVAIIILFGYNKTTVKERDLNLPDYETLVCSRKYQSNDSILYTKSASSVEIKAKNVFRDGKFSEISMSYFGKYASREEAVKAENEIHSAYNIYTSKKLSDFVPAYNIVDNTVLANFYAVASQEESIRESKKLFLLNFERDLTGLDINKFKNNYESQGFTCAIE